MDHATSLPWGALFGGLLALGVATMIVGVLSTRARELAGGYWSLGWTSLLMAGGFYLAAKFGYPFSEQLAYLSDGLFAPLMFLGAIEYRGEHSAPKWPLALGIASGALRIGLDAAGFETGHLLHGLTIAPAFLFAAAITTLGAPKAMAARRPIGALLIVFVGFEFWDAFQDWSTGQNSVLWPALIGIGFPLAAFQLSSRLTFLQESLLSARRDSGAAIRERDRDRWRFDFVFGQTAEIVAELTEDTRIINVNERAQDLLGLDPSALIGKHAISFVPEELRDVAEEAWRSHLKLGRFNTPVIFPMPNQDGEAVFLEVTVSKHEMPGEQRLLIIARDVTTRQRAEQLLEERVVESRTQLSESLHRLREQDRLAAVGTLAAGIAHQINNPIGGISAAAEFALLSRNDSDALAVQTAALETIVEETRRAGGIVRSVLRFARHQETSRWQEDLRTTVRRAAELVRPYALERSGKIEVDSNTEIMPIMMSPIEIEQLMVNLIRNAVESKDDGARIRIRTRVTEDRALVEVEDDGRGIPDDAKAQVFDPFFTTRLREGGSGLGLSIAHRIVNSHHGKIEIESLPTGGTLIRLDFPISHGEMGEKSPGER